MAALMRHGLSKGGQGLKVFSNYIVMRMLHYKKVHKRIYKKKRPNIKMEGKVVFPNCESESARSYLRSTKAYQPSSDVEDRFDELCESLTDQISLNAPLTNESKFKLLQACFNTYKHSVPNGILHTINTADDVLKFYKTEVDTQIPLDKLQNMDLPPNLHVRYEYKRFNPETDTMFGGVSAFPKSSTIVTGLKYKNKYKGYTAKSSWE